MSKGIKTYNNLSKTELLGKLTEEFCIVKEEEEQSHVKYNAATGTLHVMDTNPIPDKLEKEED